MPHADTHRFVLPVEVADREVTAARLLALGALGIWERGGELVAWFGERRPDVPADGRWELEPDRDWQAEWKADLRPVHAGRFAIVPTWLADEHEPGDEELTLVLDPGRAFGSGHHATTTLCLELLDELDLAGRRVADVGCGSGVLAIAAARRGAEVVAVDVDAAAVEVTRENAARNGVELDVRHGSVEVLDGPVDLVVANLLTDTVTALAVELAAAGDAIIVSGITAERQHVALDALRDLVVLEPPRERDGWIAARGRREAT
jgi:ribosomal protein L11 methyltransferase